MAFIYRSLSCSHCHRASRGHSFQDRHSSCGAVCRFTALRSLDDLWNSLNCQSSCLLAVCFGLWLCSHFWDTRQQPSPSSPEQSSCPSEHHGGGRQGCCAAEGAGTRGWRGAAWCRSEPFIYPMLQKEFFFFLGTRKTCAQEKGPGSTQLGYSRWARWSPHHQKQGNKNTLFISTPQSELR